MATGRGKRFHPFHATLERTDTAIPDSSRYQESTKMKKREILKPPKRSERAPLQNDESQSADTPLPVQERTVERDGGVESSPAVSQPVQPL